MEWIEMIVHTTTPGSDAVSLLLMENGSTGTMTEDRADIPDASKPHGIWELIDPKLKESMPDDVLVHAWFDPSDRWPERLSALEAGLDDLRQKYPAYGPLRLESRSIPNENWGENWKRFYHPLRAGQHFVIRPSWEQVSSLPGDHVIELDPGMAFGSGYHDTTALCLALLEKYLKPGEKVIDMGTGSGILAIGAAMLGADVLAIDIDPDAVRVAKENAALNGVADRIRVQEGNLLDRAEEESCDLCVANIIADIICSFAAPLKKHIKPGGLFLCSGVVRERADEVREALLDAGYELLEERMTEEWVAFCARRNA